jgi:hypothetical protein
MDVYSRLLPIASQTYVAALCDRIEADAAQRKAPPRTELLVGQFYVMFK